MLLSLLLLFLFICFGIAVVVVVAAAAVAVAVVVVAAARPVLAQSTAMLATGQSEDAASPVNQSKQHRAMTTSPTLQVLAALAAATGVLVLPARWVPAAAAAAPSQTGTIVKWTG